MKNDSEKLFLEAISKYDEAKHDKSKYKVAFDMFLQLAEQGEAWAMNYLGIMYGAGGRR